MELSTAIINETAQLFNVSAKDITDRQRTPELAEARTIIAYLLTRVMRFSGYKAARVMRRSQAFVNKAARMVDAMYDSPSKHAHTLASATLIRNKLLTSNNMNKETLQRNLARIIPTRVCPSCGQSYPLSKFRTRDNALRKVCEACAHKSKKGN